MALSPSFDAFAAGFEAGANQLVFTRLAADLDTPVSLMLKLADAQPDSFILESVTGGEVRGRYSIIGMKPDLIWRCHGETSELNRNARFERDAFTPCDEDPLSAIRNLLAESKIDIPAELPAASAGLFGYLGYDMIRLVEHLPNVNKDVLGLPDAVLMRPSVVAVLDGVKGEVIVCAPVWAGNGLSAKAAYAQAAERVMDAVRDLERAPASTSHDLGETVNEDNPVSNFTHDAYLQAVETAKDYIKAGDIFQVVPSQRWTQDFTLPPFSLYRALRRTNPSPFMFYEVTIRPIAGTRKRGATPQEDKALEEDLLSDKKELAEHLMLLDLGRNDTGKVSKIGTVRPTDKFIIERYSHVMHIVSNVVGELSDEHDALSALLSGLPAGTVSGAPKVRAMEIIDELEPEKRGVYGGGCGYFSANGDMDMCIALRTAVVKDQKLYTQAGGGVVYDSNPQAEFEETVNKAKAIRMAAIEAGLFGRSGNS